MTTEDHPYERGSVKTHVIHNAITADVLVADANPVDIAGAKSVCLTLTAASITTRSAVLTVYVSNDGTNFYAYNMLFSNSATTNGQTQIRVATVTRAADGTDVLWMDPATLGAIRYIKAQIDITDTGTPAGTITLTAAVQR